MDFSANSFLVPIGDKKDAREVGDIAHRLQKVLSNVELLFETEDEEIGSISAERRQFQSRFGDLNAQVDARDKERSEMLKSLAEIIDADGTNLDVLYGPKDGYQETPDVDNLSDHIETTKMGFEKLQKLQEEMHNLTSKGKPTQHLQKQKSNLKLKVVEKFKLLYSAKKLRNQNKSLGNHWKHAAEEIVNVLHKIRAEGQEGIKDLEDELIRVEKAITRQAENMVKLEHTIVEKQKTIDTLNKSMAVSNNENELLKSEVERYQDQVIKMKKELRLLRPEETQELVQSTDNHTQTFLSMVTLINAVNDEVSAASMLNQSSLRSEHSKDCHCSEENQELLRKIDILEKKIIDKETQVLKMEHRQSIDKEADGSVLDERYKLPPPTPTIDVQEVHAVAKDVYGDQTMETASSQDDVNLERRVVALMEEKEQLLMEMDKLREQNALAARELVTLKYASEQPFVMARAAFTVADKHGQQFDPKQHSVNVNEEYTLPDYHGPPVPVHERRIDELDSHQVLDQPLDSDQMKETNHQSMLDSTMKQPSTSAGHTYQPIQQAYPTHESFREKEDRILPKRPALIDTAWSAVQQNRRAQQHNSSEGQAGPLSKVIPQAPSSGSTSSKYMAFPTKGYLPHQSLRSIFKSQGQSKPNTPAIPEKEVDHGTDELQAFFKEFQSYSQHLSHAMECEIARLNQVNEDLRRRLSKQSLQQFDQLYSALHDMPFNVEETPSRPAEYTGQLVQMGRRKVGELSPFAQRDAFATVRNGERTVHVQQGTSEHAKQNQRLPSAAAFQDSPAYSDLPLADDQKQAWEASQALPDTSNRIQASGVEARNREEVNKGVIMRGVPTPTGKKGVVKPNLKFMQGQQQDQQTRFPISEPGVTQNIAKPRRESVQRQKIDDNQEWMTESSQRSHGAYEVQRPRWERLRAQFKAGIQSIQGLTGTSIELKQAMAQQFTRHFCLSEIKKVKENKSRAGTKMDIKTASTQEDTAQEDGQESAQTVNKSYSMTSLFRGMMSVLENDNRERDLLTQGNQHNKLPPLIQTKSLSSLEEPYRYQQVLQQQPICGQSKRMFLKLPTAKYPGRGYVVLQTDRFPIYDGSILRCNKDEDKPLRHRPIPKSRKQLNARHRLMLEQQFRQVSQQKGQTLWDVINSEDAGKFDGTVEENSKDGIEPESCFKDVIKAAHDQLFKPDHLEQKYINLLQKEVKV